MKIKYLTYLKSLFFSLMFLTLPFALIEQFVLQEASKVENKIAFGIAGLILAMIEMFLVLILLGYWIKQCQFPQTQTLQSYYKKHLRDLVIESLRGMGRIALGFLLIIPGIKRFIQYYLVPYVVQFDESYQEGKVDALRECETLLKNHLLKFGSLVFLTQIITFVLQIASTNFNLFTTPLAWILFYLAEILFQASVFWMFYNYYVDLKTRNGKKD